MSENAKKAKLYTLEEAEIEIIKSILLQRLREHLKHNCIGLSKRRWLSKLPFNTEKMNNALVGLVYDNLIKEHVMRITKGVVTKSIWYLK